MSRRIGTDTFTTIRSLELYNFRPGSKSHLPVYYCASDITNLLHHASWPTV